MSEQIPVNFNNTPENAANNPSEQLHQNNYEYSHQDMVDSTLENINGSPKNHNVFKKVLIGLGVALTSAAMIFASNGNNSQENKSNNSSFEYNDPAHDNDSLLGEIVILDGENNNTGTYDKLKVNNKNLNPNIDPAPFWEKRADGLKILHFDKYLGEMGYGVRDYESVCSIGYADGSRLFVEDDGAYFCYYSDKTRSNETELFRLLVLPPSSHSKDRSYIDFFNYKSDYYDSTIDNIVLAAQEFAKGDNPFATRDALCDAGIVIDVTE